MTRSFGVRLDLNQFSAGVSSPWQSVTPWTVFESFLVFVFYYILKMRRSIGHTLENEAKVRHTCLTIHLRIEIGSSIDVKGNDDVQSLGLTQVVGLAADYQCWHGNRFRHDRGHLEDDDRVIAGFKVREVAGRPSIHELPSGRCELGLSRRGGIQAGGGIDNDAHDEAAAILHIDRAIRLASTTGQGQGRNER